MPPQDDRSDIPVSAAEEALFQRILNRLTEAGHLAAAGAGYAAEAAADVASMAVAGARDAAANVGDAASAAAEAVGDGAMGVAKFVKDHPGVLAVGAVGPVGPLGLFAIGLLEVRKIIDGRKKGIEPSAQIMFRVPESLRDDIKRLSVDKKRPMEELLTEASLLLLAKYGYSSSILARMRDED